jgi:hypothetical protein
MTSDALDYFVLNATPEIAWSKRRLSQARERDDLNSVDRIMLEPYLIASVYCPCLRDHDYSIIGPMFASSYFGYDARSKLRFRREIAGDISIAHGGSTASLEVSRLTALFLMTQRELKRSFS